MSRNAPTRRFGKRGTENLGSVVIHDLYTGDMDGLSARALLPGLWALESRLSIPKQHFRWGSRRGAKDPVEVWTASEIATLQKFRPGAAGDLERRGFQEGTVFSFNGGVGQLVDRLAFAVQGMKNVTVKINSQATSMINTERGSSSSMIRNPLTMIPPTHGTSRSTNILKRSNLSITLSRLPPS